MKRILLWAGAVLLLLGGRAVEAADHHVVIITIDGFPAYLMSDPQAPIPTLRKLAAHGATAEGLKVSNPSVTWPNHTTLVTGVHPEKHSVLFNGVLVRPGPGLAVRVDPRRDKADLVAVPTLFDVLHQAGRRTAGINWPCTRNAPTLDDDFPDVPDQVTHTTPRLREELIALGLLADATDKSFLAHSSAGRDQIWTAAAAHVIRKRKPHLLLFHILVTDGIHHKYGAQTPAGYTAVAQADAQVRDVLTALEEAGLRERTTIFIVADHGFETAAKLLQPNVRLRQAGLLEAGPGPAITRARAQIISEGGIAMVYLTHPDSREQDRKQVREMFHQQEGIAAIIEPDRFKELGLPHPAHNSQMADLILVAETGYAFGNLALGEDYVVSVTLGVQNVGYHGYLSTNPKMHAVFIASGRGVQSGVKLGLIENIDVAPTAAHLLGVKLPGVDGKVLRGILKEQ